METSGTNSSRPLRRLTLRLVWALSAQYVLGAYIARFVQFPEGASEAYSWSFAWSQWAVAAHIVLALFIVLGTVALCVQAWRLRIPKALWLSVLSLLSLLLASYGGSQFIATRSDLWSYAMAISFIVAMTLLSYVLTVRPSSKDITVG
jgi:hypothetical protein